MPGIIVADTSCIILLDKIGKVDLLKKLFGKVTVTQTVAHEFGKPLPDFIHTEDPKNENYQKIFQSYLDTGESSALALAVEKENCLLIVDDNKARREARHMKINFTGTLGILVTAKEKGLIQSLTEVLEEIQETNFRISKTMIKKAKKACGE